MTRTVSLVVAWVCAAALLFAMVTEWVARPARAEGITLVSTASIGANAGDLTESAEHGAWRSAFLLFAAALTLNEMRKTRV